MLTNLNSEGNVDHNLPYLHPIFPVVIADFLFESKRRFIGKYRYFYNTNEHGYAVHTSLVALIATAVSCIFFLFFF